MKQNAKIKNFIKVFQNELDCDAEFAEMCLVVGLADMLDDDDFNEILFESCMNAEAGMLTCAAMHSAGREKEISEELSKYNEAWLEYARKH